jgi:pyruvate/2-oxoglutarate dehydrogenase complex dihydrolipoamide acyltransferase (E2) component
VSRRPRKEAPAPGVVPVYEGPEVLAALLVRAGSPLSVDEVAARFAAAVASGEARSAVIPSLFEEEPRFATPEEARRLYGNLFGLWGRIVEGRGPHDDAPEVVVEPPAAALPEPGSASGATPPSDVVDGVWRQLAATSPRERQRLRDRFANTQPELAAWMEEVSCPDAALAALHELAFELWAMFEHAFGERLGVAEWSELRQLEREPPPLEADHPPIAAYVSEQLDNLLEEDPNFGPQERAQVERALAAIAAALSAVVRQTS